MRAEDCHLCDVLLCISEISTVMQTNELPFWRRLKWRETTDMPRGLHSLQRHSLLSTFLIFSLYSRVKSYWHEWKHIKLEKTTQRLLWSLHSVQWVFVDLIGPVNVTLQLCSLHYRRDKSIPASGSTSSPWMAVPSRLSSNLPTALRKGTTFPGFSQHGSDSGSLHTTCLSPPVSSTSPWWSGWQRRDWVCVGWIELKTCLFFLCVMQHKATAQRLETYSIADNPSSSKVQSVKGGFITWLIFSMQKHVMTSDKWLDHQVSVSLVTECVLFNFFKKFLSFNICYDP